jgi:hypothetical protein
MPISFTDSRHVFSPDPIGAITKLIRHYNEKLNGEQKRVMDMTNFKNSNKKLLNKNNKTYDIAVMLKTLTEKQANNLDGRG